MRLRLPQEARHWRGEHETQVQDAICAVVRAGAVVYDIGAHVGTIALGTSRLVGPLGRVVAFEGDPDNAATLRESSLRNHLEGLKLWIALRGLTPQVMEFLSGVAECDDHRVEWK